MIAPINDLSFGDGKLRAKAMMKRMIAAVPNRSAPPRKGGFLAFLYRTATTFFRLGLKK
jgi:hypothetical protein